jgi:hypothetical protein
LLDRISVPGPECYKKVIEQAESFLRRYPQTPLRKEWLYHLALAYDTWWTLSQTDPIGGEFEWTPVSQADGGARRKAIDCYEVQRIAPDSPEARFGQLVLPRASRSAPEKAHSSASPADPFAPRPPATIGSSAISTMPFGFFLILLGAIMNGSFATR